MNTKFHDIRKEYFTGMLRKFICLVFVFVLTACMACADTEHISVDLIHQTEGYSAVLYDNTNGLPTSEANAIVETSDGFIWIGSYAGLIRYDGNTFERMDSTKGISSIKCLFVDSRDRLWMGTNDNGVAVLENGEFRMWGKLDGMKSAHTRSITEDKDGTVYIATTCGIVKIDTNYNLSMMEDDDLAEVNMRYIDIGSDGILYGLTNFGDILTIQDGKLKSFFAAADMPMGGIGSIGLDPDNPGKIYFEGADFKFYHAALDPSGTAWSEIETIDIQPLSYVQQIKSIDSQLWICASNGLGVVENGVFHLLENLPMNNSIGTMMTDYLGNLWFTSTRQGVMKIVPNQFSNLFERFDVPTNVVNTTCMCGDKLFVGTDKGLIVLDENGLVSSFPLKKAVKASGEDLGADDLIALLDGSRIRSIIRDSKGQVWISTWRKQGLLRYANGELTAFTGEDGLLGALNSSLRAVAEAEDGKIFVALTGGVNVIEGDKVIGTIGRDHEYRKPHCYGRPER